jgi:cytidylate kinase
MIVAIGGTPGSGKTTVAERFAKGRGYALVSAGTMFREMAAARGMDLDALGQEAERDHAIDRELDRRVLEEILRQDAFGNDVIVDGRLQGILLTQRGVPCLKVWIDAPLELRAIRVAGREGTTAKEAMESIVRRERSERARYKAIYGIDLGDTRPYDLVIDSRDQAPEAIVAMIGSRVGG